MKTKIRKDRRILKLQNRISEASTVDWLNYTPYLGNKTKIKQKQTIKIVD